MIKRTCKACYKGWDPELYKRCPWCGTKPVNEWYWRLATFAAAFVTAWAVSGLMLGYLRG